MIQEPKRSQHITKNKTIVPLLAHNNQPEEDIKSQGNACAKFRTETL